MSANCCNWRQFYADSFQPASINSKCFARGSFVLIKMKIAIITIIKPGSDTVIHMSQIKLNGLSSCEVWRLNQFRKARSAQPFFPTLLSWE